MSKRAEKAAAKLQIQEQASQEVIPQVPDANNDSALLSTTVNIKIDPNKDSHKQYTGIMQDPNLDVQHLY